MKPGHANRAVNGAAPGAPPRAGSPRRHTLFAQTSRARWRTFALGLFALALLMTALWLRWPETARPTIAGLLAAAQGWRTAPFAPVVALACFALGGLIVFPVNLLIAATIIVFGPLAGGIYALLGSVLSAALVHEIGRLLPARVFARVAGARGERLRARVIGHGIVAVALVRIVPIAPYSVVGFVAGAARIHRGDYLAGTALGMAPGVVLYALFVDRARAVLLDPHPLAWLALAAAIGLLVIAALVVRARSRRATTQDDA
ncbi:MAG: TVP38/TMEM64 family protein [Lysobacterales bacterium]